MDLDDGRPFIWLKKYEQLGVNLSDSELLEITKRQIEENKIELEKIRERQRLRELEQQQRINDSEFLQRQREAEQHEQWEQQQDDFILGQHQLRSKIRIRDGRAKPIDLLAHYIDVFGKKLNEKKRGTLQLQDIDLSDLRIELINPCARFDNLSVDNLEELISEIEIYMRADNEHNQQYWEDILAITKYLITFNKIQKSINDTEILEEAISQFKGKSISELDDAEDEICHLLTIDDPAIDENFYQNVLSGLKAYRARIRLNDNHQKNLKKTKLPDPPEQKVEQTSTSDSATKSTETDQEAFITAAKAGMNEREESLFSCEASIARPNRYSWSDKYQPRKPTYMNRVHTGFDWNKYNRTHYDVDNPPPKAVQGYKFNIFYPDLIDRKVTPTFTITPCQEDKDFSVIRFIAGPPYEDIGFRIVNKDWNKSPKSGYRCQFNRNVLQLWFMFKRYKYRR